MEKLIEKYCDEICSKCNFKDNCKPIDNIVYIEKQNESVAVCNKYRNQKRLNKLCRLLKNVDK